MEDRPKAVDVVTLPYPGFPDGSSTAVHCIELDRVGSGDGDGESLRSALPVRSGTSEARSDVRTDGHHALVRGCEGLSGAPWRQPMSGPVRDSCLRGWSPMVSRLCTTCPHRSRLCELRRGFDGAWREHPPRRSLTAVALPPGPCARSTHSLTSDTSRRPHLSLSV